MTRKEALQWIQVIKWTLVDSGHTVLAGHYEDAEVRIDRFTVEDFRTYARFYIPEGRAGRIRLVLPPPYEARAIAVLFGILMSIDV
jgi:hypothetical protein